MARSFQAVGERGARRKLVLEIKFVNEVEG
jgi:hypothetical protein